MPKSKELLSSNDDLSDGERVTKVTTKKRKSDTKPVEDSEEELTLKEEEKKSGKKAKVEKARQEESEEEEEPKKKAKVTKKKAAKAESEDEEEEQENAGMYKLSNMRFVNVSEFRGKALINIREYYEKDGKQLPGKKGISLSLDQWDNLKKFVKNIDNDAKKFK